MQLAVLGGGGGAKDHGIEEGGLVEGAKGPYILRVVIPPGI